ncbi:ImmA/IrrE family metallo-endopeptidase [Leucobacter allii]|uniref:ImmA/IrrE family metallo-endopeptidase n=1 Tax=Leucobacter allii TaxID=2932247 RepID=A0ABY4FQQ4_9MICO|nr:ImmA/IrrE family metallo-endopeptidase [Leucobacter allii]UOQ58596.1 ImmA/IrrE family metallo-endopeptidase [Leucobacter allii]
MHPYDVYDPWDHAAELGYDVITGPRTRPEHNAETHHDIRLIILDPERTWRQHRFDVAHECAHIVRGDQPIPEGIELRKRELACDRIAAERLIDRERLIRSMLEHPDPATWCLDLDITSRALRVYLEQHPDIADEVEQRRTRPCGERCRVSSA